MRILQALAPDVTLIQEVNYGGNTPVELRGFVESTFGSSFFYVRGRGRQIPNGVVSRWLIIATGTWDDPYTTTPTRDFIWRASTFPGRRISGR